MYKNMRRMDRVGILCGILSIVVMFAGVLLLSIVIAKGCADVAEGLKGTRAEQAWQAEKDYWLSPYDPNESK